MTETWYFERRFEYGLTPSISKSSPVERTSATMVRFDVVPKMMALPSARHRAPREGSVEICHFPEAVPPPGASGGSNGRTYTCGEPDSSET